MISVVDSLNKIWFKIIIGRSNVGDIEESSFSKGEGCEVVWSEIKKNGRRYIGDSKYR